MKRILTRIYNKINHVPVVTVIPFHGVIAAQGNSNQSFSNGSMAKVIEKAFKPKDLRAVVLSINCPGGSPTQSNMIMQRIRKHARDKNVPVLAFCEDVAASGGYMLACAADEIYVDENSIVGSIGVISASFGAKDLLDRVGLERRVHTSGDRKSMLDPFKPEKDEDVIRLKEMQKQVHENFIELVKSRRGTALQTTADGMFEGEIWVGQQAVDMGLADCIGHQVDIVEEKFGKNVDVRLIETNKSLLSRLGIFNSQSICANFIESLENKTAWQHYGR